MCWDFCHISKFFINKSSLNAFLIYISIMESNRGRRNHYKETFNNLKLCWDLYGISLHFQEQLQIQEHVNKIMYVSLNKNSKTWLISCCQFTQNFFYSKRNQVPSKTHLIYRKNISNNIRNLTYLIFWSEKYQPKIEGTYIYELLQTYNIQLNIYVKP